MPLLTEREHMQLWCPEARVVVVEAQGKKIATPDDALAGTPLVEASPALNRLDMGVELGTKIPKSCLCFGSHCGAWQWVEQHKGTDGKVYPDIERLRAQDPNMPAAQMGFCGKASGHHPITHGRKEPKLPPPAAANQEGKETLQ